jgi:hypothetical protein
MMGLVVVVVVVVVVVGGGGGGEGSNVQLWVKYVAEVYYDIDKFRPFLTGFSSSSLSYSSNNIEVQ